MKHHFVGARLVKTLNHIGFDAVISGSLDTGVAFESGAPIFGGWFAATELQVELKAALQIAPAAADRTTSEPISAQAA
ncbi:hypothetical protein JOF28_001124 [Leucobacter exalbidus]|uniref:Uncharacterized protein n=1 Tax=Leucobacter exalbidus TaxID=662960 RepID=A0A940T384_9MICO|nr:hypothetical protein [Leucobacter exalbidus]MBP1325892.1 hypothetical protein [Leucobacter exalbidus]